MGYRTWRIEIQASCLESRSRYQPWKLENQVAAVSADLRLLQGLPWLGDHLQAIDTARSSDGHPLQACDGIRNLLAAIENPRGSLCLQTALPNLAVEPLLQHRLGPYALNHHLHAALATSDKQ
ncbi:hypothetical protein [Synechococcus sp. BIOS-U3-1]|uniref:hypothetical protein n=1 Tax=Synechococcus sp. BIOS-U3-1 TaxID=1400865 RepID=UPI0021042B90|nr:hypothetical protein [Synechococcus sp. BIOS-U3-1]